MGAAGQIKTKPDAWPAQLEVHPESELPAKLQELGWTLVERGCITRIGPQILTHDLKGREKAKPSFGNSYDFHQRNIFDVILPQPVTR